MEGEHTHTHTHAHTHAHARTHTRARTHTHRVLTFMGTVTQHCTKGLSLFYEKIRSLMQLIVHAGKKWEPKLKRKLSH